MVGRFAAPRLEGVSWPPGPPGPPKIDVSRSVQQPCIKNSSVCNLTQGPQSPTYGPQAVRQNGEALQFAAGHLRADREIVLEAPRRASSLSGTRNLV